MTGDNESGRTEQSAKTSGTSRSTQVGRDQYRDQINNYGPAPSVITLIVALVIVAVVAITVWTGAWHSGASVKPTPGPATPTRPAPALEKSRTPSTEPSRTPATKKPAGTVPDGYLGTWEGEFTKPGERATTLRRIVIRKGAVGAEIADVLTSSKDSLCQSNGTLVSAGTGLVVAPKLTSGIPSDLCTASGDITLRRHGNTGITWQSEGTTVTLHRPASAARTIPAQFLGTWTAQDGNDPTSSVRMTINQGTLGSARAEFIWEGDAHHCEGFSVLVSISDVLRFSPETVTKSEPERFCTQTPTRIMSQPQGDTMHMEWVAPSDGSAPRAFTFNRID
ncbi:hypothetical protein ACTPOK_22975 [Streptomyces inhibens]|uniref:hypothetical protein n=1 Tax=Streptomyces inhibens TaxID=2293571 RepID=UPI00402AA751